MGLHENHELNYIMEVLFFVTFFFSGGLVSGEAPQFPVVSKTTGHIYEKHLIESYLEENGKCPITEQNMTRDDLIPIQGEVFFSFKFFKKKKISFFFFKLFIFSLFNSLLLFIPCFIGWYSTRYCIICFV